MKITAKHYAKLLLEISKDTKHLDAMIEKFIALLKKNKNTRLLPKIINEFFKQYNTEHKIQPVIAYFVEPKDTKILNNVKDFLKEEIETATVELTTEYDQTLVGGIKLRIEDFIIDASIKNKIRKLKQGLTS